MTAKARLQTGTTINGTNASASRRSHCSPAESEIGRGCVKTPKQFMLSVLAREACHEAVRRG
jgi:hypothetical protein